MIVRNARVSGFEQVRPMLTSYVYSYSSGNLTIVFTNLPAGICDVYLYGHGTTLDDYSIFEVWSDQVCWASKAPAASATGRSRTTGKWAAIRALPECDDHKRRAAGDPLQAQHLRV